MNSPLPPWFPLLATGTIFIVMLSIGLLLGRDERAAAVRRRRLLASILFSVVVPVPALAVLFVLILGITGPVAVGIVLMAISPGAPVALRRALDAGGHTRIAPALHLSIVLAAVATVPLSLIVLDALFGTGVFISPLVVGRQVLVAQLLPLGLGAAVRVFRPAVAGRIQPLLARLGNLLFLGVVLVCVVLLWPMLRVLGWVPVMAGVALTAAALTVGTLFAWQDADARPSAAVAAAMRNAGLALLIASANNAPPEVTAAVFAYTLGSAAVVMTYVTWQARAATDPRGRTPHES